MTLARLDNEVIFKKAFTNPEVLKSFVKDITGLDINPDIIETEKKYDTQEGGTDIRYDIFVEDTKQRIIIEIQKAFYDYHFD